MLFSFDGSRLCGYQPFQAEDQVELTDEITHARYEFHERYWRNVSQDAKDFIRSLLQLDPSKRPTATQALANKWMTGKDALDVDILDTVRDNFNARRKFKSAVRAVKAMNRMRSASASNGSAGSNSTTANSPSSKPPLDMSSLAHALSAKSKATPIAEAT